MDWVILIFSGVIIGVIVAAPVGPVNLICIRRTLAFGRLNGFLSGTGAALGDGLFAVVVAFGLTAISAGIEAYSDTIKSVGGVILVIMGVHTIMANPRPFTNRPDVSLPDPNSAIALGPTIATTFVLTITNPATLIGFGALFSSWLGRGLMDNPSYATAGVTVGSVILGSLVWWGTLTGLMGRLQSRMTYSRLKWLNRISGGIITALGFGVLIERVVDALR
ncbi:MAG: LysE family translocator [Alphaproteobacteria bacterium]